MGWLLRLGLSHWRHQPWQGGLALVGVALGVAVVVAIDIANESARRAFEMSDAIVGGAATHRIVGGPAGLPDGLYARLRLELGIRASAPWVEGGVEVAGQRLRLVGIDPLAGLGTRGVRVAGDGGRALPALVAGGVWLAEGTARRLGLETGDRVRVEGPGASLEAPLVGALSPGGAASGAAIERLIVADVSTAQVLLGKVGRLDHVALALTDDGVDRVRAALPGEAELVGAEAGVGARREMTRAFEINLTALSLLALLIGAFLVYNTQSFSVLRRRPELATLRALGVTRREILALVLVEALVLGLAATAAGLAGGVLIAEALVGLVARTIDDLYFALEVSRTVLAPQSLAKGAVLGVGATLVATLAPAVEANRTPPRAGLLRSEIESTGARRRHRLAVAGAIGAGLGVVVTLVSGKGLVAGFAGLFLFTVGIAAMAPLVLEAVLGLAERAGRDRVPTLVAMTLRGLSRSLSRTGVAVAALAVAVSATIGIGVMIDSFRTSVERWLAASLRADVYLRDPGRPIAPGLAERLSGLPEVERVGLGRRVRLESARGPTELFVLDVGDRGFAGFDLKSGERESARRRFQAGTGVLVSEPFSHHRAVGVGDPVELRTRSGPRRFEVVGVFYDYASDRGVVAMHRDAFLEHWGDPEVSTLSLYLGDDVDAAAFANGLPERMALPPTVVLRSNRDLREASLAVFDRTFAVTAVLRVLAVLVAVVGIMAAMMSIQLERSREVAVLRALGLAPRQIWAMGPGETALLGLLSGLVAVPLGLVTAIALIDVINRRAFGWSMATTVDPAILLQGVALAVAAALAAGVYPAWRMASRAPVAGLRAE